MEEKKYVKISLGTAICLAVIFILIVCGVVFGVYYYTNNNTENESLSGIKDTVNVSEENNTIENEEEKEVEESNSNTFSDETVKEVLQKYMDLCTSKDASPDTLLSKLGFNVIRNNNEEIKYIDDGYYIKTDVKYSDYKNTMLNYVTEEIFNNEFTEGFKNENGYVWYFNGGASGTKIEVKKVLKIKDNEYKAEMYFEEENSSFKVKFSVGDYNGKCVIADYKDENEEDEISENQIEENVVLYRGIEISKKSGIQVLIDMDITQEATKKYNTKYHNYEKGKYEGITEGTFGKETYEGCSIVNNVKRIAMTQKYNAIPRKYREIKELPEQLSDMADYSSVDINEIDLDGDGKNEYLVCFTVNYKEGEIGDGKPQASSGIMLMDSNYKLIDNLVSLENGFWANIKEENQKVFLSLDNVEYIDIDNDGKMEIIIEVPMYDGIQISIIRYNNNKIEGKTNYKASVEA